jgi:hypothetical protein
MRWKRSLEALVVGGAFGLSFVLGAFVWLVLPFVEVGQIGSFRYLGLTVGAAGVIAGIALNWVSASGKGLRFALAGAASFAVGLGIVAAGAVFVLFFFATLFGFVGVPPGVPPRLRLPLVTVVMSPLVWAAVIGVITGACLGGLLGLITRRVSVIRSAVAGLLGFGPGGLLGLGVAVALKQMLAPRCRSPVIDYPTAYSLMLVLFGAIAFFCGGVSLGSLYSGLRSDQRTQSTRD